MESNINEVYYDVERAIDLAFNGHFVLKFYDYLKIKGVLGKEVKEFIQSSAVSNLNDLVVDLDEYLQGGSDDQHKQLREAYGHIPKPQARKIRNYLSNILEDAVKYNYDKRPGRRKSKTK